MEEFVEIESEWIETVQEWDDTPGSGGAIGVFTPFYYEMLMQGEL